MPKCGHCREFSGSATEVIAHQRSCSTDPRWARVVELRAEGKVRTADRVAKRLKGVKGRPMPAETKEYLRRRREERKAAGVVNVKDARESLERKTKVV